MKVLLCIRQDYIRNIGGDTIKLLKIAQYLKKKNVEVDINSGQIWDFSVYDYIHLFNISKIGEMYKCYKIAHKYKKSIMLTPMYWDYTKYYNYINDTENIKLWNRCKPYRQEILNGCNIIYPSSEVELNQIKSECNNNFSYNIIYNGVDIENEELPLYDFKKRYNLDKYVLSVGRICRRKNQLILAEICKRLGIEFVMIGRIEDKSYFNKCMSNNNVKYLGLLDSYNLYNAYKFAKVHAAPSFVEVAGFSSLNAAASGCNVVATNEGSAKEYFGDLAYYCDPYDEHNIYDTVQRSLNTKKTDKLKGYVIENFNWERTISQLYNTDIK